MLSFEKRVLFFLLGCIPIRILLAAVPLYVDKTYLPYYGGILLLIAASFFVLYFNQMRLNAFEGGGKTWWADFRLLHGLLYLCAAIYSFQEKLVAWVPLMFDVMLGLALFIHHHFM